MTSCVCGALPCPACLGCSICQCVCPRGPRSQPNGSLPLEARPPPAKRRRPSPALPTTAFLPQPPHLPPPAHLPALSREPDFHVQPFHEPLVPTPVASTPAARPNPASAHSCIVSSNDRGSRHEAQLQQAREKLSKLLPLLELDSRNVTSLVSDVPGTSLEYASNLSAIQLMQNIIRQVATIVSPSDPDGLSRRFLSRSAGEGAASSTAQEMLVSNIINAMKATRRGTLARRYVRSVLCGTMTRTEVNALLGYSDDQSEQNASFITSGPSNSGGGGITGSSVARKGLDEDDEEEEEEDDDREVGRNISGRLPRMSSKTFSRSRRDWDTLRERGELQPSKFGRARVRDEALRQLLAFLFSPENIVLVSWTSQRIVVHGRKLDLPAVVGSKSGGALHEAYCKLLKGKNKKPLSRGSFYAVAKTLTRREVTRVLPIDNMTQTLVRDPLILLRDIIMRGIPYADRSAFLKKVDKVEWFLMHSFGENHLVQDAEGFHDLNFALQSDSLMGDVSSMLDRSVQCTGCLFPFSLLTDIEERAQLQRNSPDARTVISCQNRFIYYLGLLCRKTAQDRGIEAAVNEIVSRKLHNRVIVFMSQLSYGEAVRTGKTHLIPNEKDVSLYGAVVIVLGRQNTDTQNEKDISTTDLETRYYTHVVSNDLDCDVRVAAVVIEALLHQISLDVAHAEELIFVSDNSPIYKNSILPALVPHLARELGLRALRYIYSCSQLCEFLIEAYFELVMGIGRGSLSNGQVLTPTQLVHAINTEQEHLNIAGEFISLTEDFQKFSSFLQNDSSAFPSIGVKNVVEYQLRQISDPANPADSGSVITKLHDFSGVGMGTSFEIKESSVRALTGLMGYTGRDSINRSPEDFAWVGPVTGVGTSIGARRIPLSGLPKVPLANGVSEGVVADILSRLRHRKTSATVDEKSSTTDIGVSAVGSKGMGSRTCVDCRRSFKSESFQKSHICKGSPLDKDVSARAVVVASEMLREGALPIFRNSSEHLSSDSLSLQDTKNHVINTLWFGWARQSISEEYIESPRTQQYKKEVFERLDKEEDDQRKDPLEIRSFLRAKYVDRNDIPNEKTIRHWHLLHEATKRIQPFYMTAVDGAPIVSYNEDTQSAGSRRSRMNPRYLARITSMHQRHLSLPEPKRPKPRYMYKEFEDFFRDEQGRLPPDFPGQKQVMNKINALRTKSKQR